MFSTLHLPLVPPLSLWFTFFFISISLFISLYLNLNLLLYLPSLFNLSFVFNPPLRALSLQRERERQRGRERETLCFVSIPLDSLSPQTTTSFQRFLSPTPLYNLIFNYASQRLPVAVDAGEIKYWTITKAIIFLTFNKDRLTEP